MQPTVKSGFLSSEFWLKMIVAIAITLLTELSKTVDTLGLPPVVVLAFHLIGPALLAWLAKSYADGRVDLKKMAMSLLSQSSAAGADAAKDVTPGPGGVPANSALNT